MPQCSSCGSTSVKWGKTKNGHPFLVEVRPPIPHSRFCPKQTKPQKQKSLGKAPGRSERDKEAISYLLELKWKVRECEEAVDAVSADCTGDVAKLVEAALAHVGKEK